MIFYFLSFATCFQLLLLLGNFVVLATYYSPLTTYLLFTTHCNCLAGGRW